MTFLLHETREILDIFAPSPFSFLVLNKLHLLFYPQIASNRIKSNEPVARFALAHQIFVLGPPLLSANDTVWS